MKFQVSLQSLEEQIKHLSLSIAEEKKALDETVQLFIESPTSRVKDNNGLIEDYFYFLYPFKGYSLTNHKYYALLAKYISKMIPKETEVIVSIEADGIGIATLVAAELKLPLIISKHYDYTNNCVEFTQQAGYHSRTMYLPKIIDGKKCAIVDCMVSTGGTVKAMIEAMKSLDEVTITGIYCVNDKNNYREKSYELFGYPYGYALDTIVNEETEKVEAKLSWIMKKTIWESLDAEFFSLTQDCSSFSNFSSQGYQVGSIIVDAESFEILAWGYRKGNLHAEQDAISMLKNNCHDWSTRKLALYSTMEPCTYRNDKGQIPCATHIANLTNCKWVIIGSKDHANKRIYAKGIEQLLEANKHIRLIETGEILRPKESMKPKQTITRQFNFIEA